MIDLNRRFYILPQNGC